MTQDENHDALDNSSAEDQKAVDQLASLALDGADDVKVEWSAMNVEKEQLYRTTAESVYHEFKNLGAKQNTTAVALATIVKLLADKYVLKTKLGMYDGESNDQA